MKSLTRTMRRFFSSSSERAHRTWKSYRRLRKPYQIVIALAVIGVAIFGLDAIRSGPQIAQTSTGRNVTLTTVGELASAQGSVNLYGTVRSVTEAKILAQTGGVVRVVRATLGSRVSAGAVIAELENDAERASVLTAEGAYEAAVAAQTSVSPVDAKTAAINSYNAAYNTLDTSLQTDVDTFFGEPTPYGPRLLITATMYDFGELSTERRELSDRMKAFQRSLATAATGDPVTLLTEALEITRDTVTFLNRLATAANSNSSSASAAQLTALSDARTTITALVTTLATALETYRSESVTTTSSTDAAIKQALGGLRSAQAALEQTMVRAPIGGQLNFLPIRVGEYVAALQHVATVAQNGSLEVVAYVSEQNRDLLTVGGDVLIEDKYPGVVTSVAPALDPTTKQIEVRLAVTAADGLVNGQSVAIALPNMPASTPETEGPLSLPLTAVKLRSGDRVVFSVGEDGRLVAHPVEVGEVRGDRIEIVSPLERALLIVTDARGLAEGEAVEVVSATPVTPEP